MTVSRRQSSAPLRKTATNQDPSRDALALTAESAWLIIDSNKPDWCRVALCTVEETISWSVNIKCGAGFARVLIFLDDSLLDFQLLTILTSTRLSHSTQHLLACSQRRQLCCKMRQCRRWYWADCGTWTTRRARAPGPTNSGTFSPYLGELLLVRLHQRGVN